MWPQRHSCTELSVTSELSLFIHIHLQQFTGIQWKLAIWFSLVLICFLLFFQQFSVFVLLYLYWKKTIPKTLRFFHIFILIIDHFPFQFRAVLSVRQQGLEFVCGYFFSFHCSGNTVYMFTIFQVSHQLMWGTIPASTSRCLKYIRSKWLFDAAVGAFMYHKITIYRNYCLLNCCCQGKNKNKHRRKPVGSCEVCSWGCGFV